ncbi:MAG: hypothetical protein WCI43_06880, partial [Candidatus Firestonebacteria bacterium]
MKFVKLLLVIIFPLLLAAGENNKVLIVVNDNSPESLEVGAYYAKKRNIPESNICRIKTSDAGSIEYKDYVSQIAIPVRNAAKSGIQYIVMTYGT